MQLKTIAGKVTKQYDPGRLIGAIIDTYAKTAVVISAAQFLMMLIVLYTTSAGPFFKEYMPWVSFSLYIAVVIIGVMFFMILVFKIAVPSHYDFFAQQFWSKENPITGRLDAIDEKLKELDEKISKTPATN